MRALGLAELRVTPDPVRVAARPLWGALCAEDRLAGAVILSDDTGSSASATTLCVRVHAERLV